jgi:putative ABC transport system permease protein
VRYRDLLALALSALYQQKVRTLLTMLGVVFGSFVLVASLSVRLGVHDTVQREYSRFGPLRLINVNPSYGENPSKESEEKLKVEGKMSPARRQRLLRQMRQRWQQQHAPEATVRLTPARLQALSALTHVDAVVPSVNWQARANFAGKSERALVISAPADDGSFRKRIIAGAYVSAGDPHGVVVS